ncbi:MAG: DUF1674 domain-containing protein [Pseudomonadota bacterium]
MANRMSVDPTHLPDARDDAPACPTSGRKPEVAVTPLTAEQEAARRAALPEAARRALEEADARKAKDLGLPKELGGRDGPEPVRYGDWELKGIAIDF